VSGTKTGRWASTGSLELGVDMGGGVGGVLRALLILDFLEAEERLACLLKALIEFLDLRERGRDERSSASQTLEKAPWARGQTRRITAASLSRTGTASGGDMAGGWVERTEPGQRVSQLIIFLK